MLKTKQLNITAQVIVNKYDLNQENTQKITATCKNADKEIFLTQIL